MRLFDHSRVSQWARLVGLVVLLLGFLALAQPVLADKLTGVDFVFLIDQSGSMCGSACGSEKHPQANDPAGLRFSGAQELVQRIALYRLDYYHESPVTFQVAAVYFGDSASTIVFPTIIWPDTDMDLDAQVQPLVAKLAASEFSSNLGNTDHFGAIVEAERLLDEMSANWGDGRHKQVILMLTDGVSSLDCEQIDAADAQWCNADNEFSYGTYKSSMLAHGQQMRQAAGPGALLYVVGINAEIAPDSRDGWGSFEQYWDDVSGGHAALVDASTMWKNFEDTLAELTVNDPDLPKTTAGQVIHIPDEKNEYLVYPYLQELSFIVHKPSPQARVGFTQNGKELHLESNLVRGSDEFIERIAIPNPPPGKITITRPINVGIVNIWAVEVGADIDCDLAGQTPQYVPTLVTCAIKGKDGAIPDYGDSYPIDLYMQTSLDGSSAKQEWLMSSLGGQTYATYIAPALPGEYLYGLRAETKGPEGDSYNPFGRPPNGVGAFDVYRARPALVNDGAATVLVPHPVTFAWTNVETGAPILVPDASMPFIELEAHLVNGADSASTRLASKDGQYDGAFTPLLAGDYAANIACTVTDPKNSVRSSVFDEPAGAVTAQAPRAAWNGFGSWTPQYEEATIAFNLTDAAGRDLEGLIDPAISLRVQVYARHEGNRLEPAIELNALGKAKWEGRFTPNEPGSYDLLVSAWGQDPQRGEVVLIDEAVLHTFRVKPMTLLAIKLVAPPNKAQQAWKNWLWIEQPLEIRVDLVDDKGAPVGLTDAFEAAGQPPIKIRLIDPNGVDLPPITLIRNGPASLAGQLVDYDVPWYIHPNLGWYTVEALATAATAATYTFGGAKRLVSGVRLVRSPLWWLLPALLGALLVFMLYRATVLAYRRMWSAVGSLSAAGAAGSPWVRHLAGRGHTVTFRGKACPSAFQLIQAHQQLGTNGMMLTVIGRGGIVLYDRTPVANGTTVRNENVSLTYSTPPGPVTPTRIAPTLLFYVFLVAALGLGAALIAVLTAVSKSL